MQVEEFIKSNLRKRLQDEGFSGIAVDNGASAGYDEMKRNSATFESGLRVAKMVAKASGRVR